MSWKLCFHILATVRSRYRVRETYRAHFITATIVEWLPVFASAGCCDVVVRSLEFCRDKKALKVYGWVILDTHLHAVLAAPELAAVLRDLKSFTARRILTQVEREGAIGC